MARQYYYAHVVLYKRRQDRIKEMKTSEYQLRVIFGRYGSSYVKQSNSYYNSLQEYDFPNYYSEENRKNFIRFMKQKKNSYTVSRTRGLTFHFDESEKMDKFYERDIKPYFTFNQYIFKGRGAYCNKYPFIVYGVHQFFTKKNLFCISVEGVHLEEQYITDEMKKRYDFISQIFYNTGNVEEQWTKIEKTVDIIDRHFNIKKEQPTYYKELFNYRIAYNQYFGQKTNYKKALLAVSRYFDTYMKM